MKPGRVVAVAVGLWLAIAVLAILNGTLREAVLIPVVGDAAAQVVSVLLLATAILVIQWLMVRGPWRDLTRTQLLAVGTAWMLGTILLEFALGRLVLDMTWGDLLQQYNLLRGHLWPIIPLLLLLGLPLIKALRGRREAGP